MNTTVSELLGHKGATVHSVPETVTVEHAVAVMNRHKIGCLVVLGGEAVTGIFTERDVLVRVVAAHLDPKTTPLHSVMTSRVITIDPDTTIQEVMSLITNNRCRHFPVVRDGKLCGLISIGDITRWLVETHRAEAEQLRTYINGFGS